MLGMFRDFGSDKKGVTLIEYALIGGLVSVVAISLLSSVGSKIKNIFSSVNISLASA